MVAVAAQHVLVRVHIFRLTPAPPDRRLELALTRALAAALDKFRITLPGVCPPNPTDRVQCRHRQPLFFLARSLTYH